MKSLIESLSTEAILYVFLGFFGLSLGGQAWSSYKMSQLEDTIRLQMKGTFSENAQKIKALDEELKMAKSTMLTDEQLEKKSQEIISRLSEETQNQLKGFQSETKTQIDSIGIQVSNLTLKLTKGKIKRGGGKGAKTPEAKAPAPEKWEGFKIEFIDWCEQSPENCDPFYFIWESEHLVKGKPIATFTSPNLWRDEVDISLNLAFRVTAINFREDPREGIAQNQSVRVEAGYLSDEGTFVTLTETELFKGDPLLSPEFFHSATQKVKPEHRMRMFEPSVQAGIAWSPFSDIGLLAGGSFLNFRGGDIRLGASALVNTSYFGIGPHVSYYPKVLGKNLKLAPSLNALYGADGRFTWGAGILFLVW